MIIYILEKWHFFIVFKVFKELVDFCFKISLSFFQHAFYIIALSNIFSLWDFPSRRCTLLTFSN